MDNLTDIEFDHDLIRILLMIKAKDRLFFYFNERVLTDLIEMDFVTPDPSNDNYPVKLTNLGHQKLIDL